MTVLLEYFDLFHANIVSSSCSMFNKAIPVPFVLEQCSTLFATCYTPRFASIAFMMIVMMMTIDTSGYKSVSEYLDNRYRSIPKAQYSLRYDTDPIIGGTLQKSI